MNEIRHVAVLGAGLIGAGWAALFGLCGRRVTVIDPHPHAATRVADAVAQARPVLAALGSEAELSAVRQAADEARTAELSALRWQAAEERAIAVQEVPAGLDLTCGGGAGWT